MRNFLGYNPKKRVIVQYIHAIRPFLHGLENNWFWLIGLFLMAEPLLDSLWEGYRTYADRYVSRKVRTRVSWIIVVSCAFIAVFFAFADQLQKTEIAVGQRDEVRRQSPPPVQQSTIDRLSGDLTAARGQIDAQAETIKQQEKELEQQKGQVSALQPKPARTLTDKQKADLRVNFAPIAAMFPTLQISAPISDGEAQAYAKQLADFFNSVNIKVPTVGVLIPLSAPTADSGLTIGVKSLPNHPKKAEMFATAMMNSGIKIKASTVATLGPDEFMLVVGGQ
jgi:hypothetical protein